MKRIGFKLSRLSTIAFCGFVLVLASSCQDMAILLQAYADSLNPGKNAQKRTVADIRNTGTAMLSWLTDQVGAAAAGQSQVPPPMDMGEYTPISRDDLRTILVPDYIQEIPELDGWKSPYEYYLEASNPMAEKIMSIRSAGRDGKFSDTTYTAGAFDPASLDEDVVWADGFFVRWPQKK